jgi:hypothetical protein
MTRSLRTALVALAAFPLAFAPAAHAGVDTAAFSGAFKSTCSLPVGADGEPVRGPYSCTHSATSTACSAVADTGAVTAYVKLCKANLTSGKTAGAATPTGYYYGYWTCDNGSGTGSFTYQPSTNESASFTFPVNLTVDHDVIVITGSYTQAGTNRHIVVNARIPAVCAYGTQAPAGYEGAVTPF